MGGCKHELRVSCIRPRSASCSPACPNAGVPSICLPSFAHLCARSLPRLQTLLNLTQQAAVLEAEKQALIGALQVGARVSPGLPVSGNVACMLRPALGAVQGHFLGMCPPYSGQYVQPSVFPIRAVLAFLCFRQLCLASKVGDKQPSAPASSSDPSLFGPLQRHTEELAQAEESPIRSGTSSRLGVEQVRLMCGRKWGL